MTEFTLAQKLEEIEREIAMRTRHYPGMVGRGDLTVSLARRRIDILKAVADDYRALNENVVQRVSS